MNWGNKILVTFIIFGLFIFYLVYKSSTTKTDLVEEDYYKKELEYQKIIDASKRAKELSSSISITSDEQFVYLKFPSEMKNKKVEGTLWFYCSYDQSKDLKNISIVLDTNVVHKIDMNKIFPGKYTVKAEWNADGMLYYQENNFEK